MNGKRRAGASVIPACRAIVTTAVQEKREPWRGGKAGPPENGLLRQAKPVVAPGSFLCPAMCV